jgi:hypothetical protein
VAGQQIQNQLVRMSDRDSHSWPWQAIDSKGKSQSEISLYSKIGQPDTSGDPFSGWLERERYAWNAIRDGSGIDLRRICGGDFRGRVLLRRVSCLCCVTLDLGMPRGGARLCSLESASDFLSIRKLGFLSPVIVAVRVGVGCSRLQINCRFQFSLSPS